MYTAHTDNSKVNRSEKYSKEYSLNFNFEYLSIADRLSDVL